MATGGLTINIDFDITDETLNRILYLLEIWQNHNPDMRIIGEEVRTETGFKTVFKVEPKWRGEQNDIRDD